MPETPLPRHNNVAPTRSVPVVRATEGGPPEAVFMRWGLVPRWAKDARVGSRMINARAETVATKPAFRSAYKRRRCVLNALNRKHYAVLSHRRVSERSEVTMHE